MNPGLNEPMTVGGSYALSILNDWLDIKKKSVEFREKMLAGEANSPESKKIARDFVSLMTVLWGDLRPKIEGRDDTTIPKLFADRYLAFERYYYSPTLLPTEENAGDIFIAAAIHAATVRGLPRFCTTAARR